MKNIVLALILYAVSLLGFAAEPSHQQFEQQIKASVAPLAGKEIAALKVLYLSVDIGPWMDTGMPLNQGDKVTVVLNGKVWLSRAYNLAFEAPITVWMKIAEAGPIFRAERETNTFVAQQEGTLRLKNYPGQRWVDPSGKYLGEPAELDRKKSKPRTPPSDWHYLWELGPSQVYAEVVPQKANGAPSKAIDLHTQNDVAILQKDVSIELTPETILQRKWKADKLPAKVAENSLPTHDYMSIAVEFDNGRDITFFRSHDLPVGLSFHCPLPGWDHRETHVVARSGEAEVGKWIGEEKNLIDYYSKAIGGTLPKRITRVWLIAVSLFQHGEGASQFGELY